MINIILSCFDRNTGLMSYLEKKMFCCVKSLCGNKNSDTVAEYPNNIHNLAKQSITAPRTRFTNNSYLASNPLRTEFLIPEDGITGKVIYGKTLTTHRGIFLIQKNNSPVSRYYSTVGEKSPVVSDTKVVAREWGGPEAEKSVLHLQDNFLEVIKNHDSLLIYFYTVWCHHCKRFKSIYGAAALKMKEEKVPGHLAAIDVTKRMDLADMFNIVAVPDLKYFRKGELIKVYDSKRTVDDIVNFMKNPPTVPFRLPKIDI